MGRGGALYGCALRDAQRAGARVGSRQGDELAWLGGERPAAAGPLLRGRAAACCAGLSALPPTQPPHTYALPEEANLQLHGPPVVPHQRVCGVAGEGGGPEA